MDRDVAAGNHFGGIPDGKKMVRIDGKSAEHIMVRVTQDGK